jgi:hypothetical protein
LDLANGRIVLFWMGIAVTTVAVGVLGYALIKYVDCLTEFPLQFFPLFQNMFWVLRKFLLHRLAKCCVYHKPIYFKSM